MSTEAAPSTDRIEKQFTVKVRRSRVWRAISNADEMGKWFGMAFDAPFAPGAKINARLTSPKYAHVTLEMVIDAVKPETYFSYRWHPGALDTSVDYTVEPMTLVEFTLRDVAEGTEITIVESGFDKLPANRRGEAFRMNQGGWNGQAKNLAAYVD